jgi:hypothetical protein
VLLGVPVPLGVRELLRVLLGVPVGDGVGLCEVVPDWLRVADTLGVLVAEGVCVRLGLAVPLRDCVCVRLWLREPV